MTKPDYEYKAIVMQSGLVERQRQISKSIYAETYHLDTLPHMFTKQEAEDLQEDLEWSYPEAWHEAEKINKASYNRASRLSKKISKMLAKGPCVFLTLTFTPETLESTSGETRKKYVKNYLKSQSDTYIANIDFGSKNGREHYHAVILSDNVNYKSYQKYGAIKGEKIKPTSNTKALAKYVSKLTNHAIKETCKRNAIIYSR